MFDFAEHIATSTRKSDKITFLHHLFADGVIKVAMSVFHVRKYDQGSTISGRTLQDFAAVLQPFEFIKTDHVTIHGNEF